MRMWGRIASGFVALVALSSCGFVVETDVAKYHERIEQERVERAQLEAAVQQREASLAESRRIETATERRQRRELASIQEAFGGDIPVAEEDAPAPPVAPADAPLWCAEMRTIVFNGEQAVTASNLIDGRAWLGPIYPAMDHVASTAEDPEVNAVLDPLMEPVRSMYAAAQAAGSQEELRSLVLTFASEHAEEFSALVNYATTRCEGAEEFEVDVIDGLRRM